MVMNPGATLRRTRQREGLSLRELGRRARTSHSTLAAYEAGRTVPSVATLDRILAAAGYSARLELSRRVGGRDPSARGRELAEALELAELFPARHARELQYPIFGAHSWR